MPKIDSAANLPIYYIFAKYLTSIPETLAAAQWAILTHRSWQVKFSNIIDTLHVNKKVYFYYLSLANIQLIYCDYFIQLNFCLRNFHIRQWTICRFCVEFASLTTLATKRGFPFTIRSLLSSYFNPNISLFLLNVAGQALIS